MRWALALLTVLTGCATVGAAPRLQKSAEAFFERLRTSTDIVWLERLAGDDESVQIETPSGYGPKKTRSFALVRLGAIGTPAAIAAIRRIEAAARSWKPWSERMNLDRVPHPAAHMGDGEFRPFVQIAGNDAVTYGLIAMSLLGGSDVFLTTSRAPRLSSEWTRPNLVSQRAPFGISDPMLTWTGPGWLQLEFSAVASRDSRTVLVPIEPPAGPLPSGRQTWAISIPNVIADRDRDGWTDVEERRIGLRFDTADSDGDGIRDDVDVCPNYAASPTEATDVEAAILRKVFFAGYGIHRSHDLLLVSGASRPLQLWGSRGPVLYGVDRSQWVAEWGGLGPPILNWKLRALAADTATVQFGDYVANMAAAGYTATLKRIDGEWFVVAVVMNWIS